MWRGTERTGSQVLTLCSEEELFRWGLIWFRSESCGCSSWNTRLHLFISSHFWWRRLLFSLNVVKVTLDQMNGHSNNLYFQLSSCWIETYWSLLESQFRLLLCFFMKMITDDKLVDLLWEHVEPVCISPVRWGCKPASVISWSEQIKPPRCERGLRWTWWGYGTLPTWAIRRLTLCEQLLCSSCVNVFCVKRKLCRSEQPGVMLRK